MTMRRIAFVSAIGIAIGGGFLQWPVASAPQQQTVRRAVDVIGQSSTQLADGRWLVLGGERASGVSGAAVIVDPRTGASTPVAAAMTVPRTRHTATLLPDGTVLIVGGRGSQGQLVQTAELFDPQIGAFMPIAFEGSTPRAGHSATLLTDGRVLISGGAGED